MSGLVLTLKKRPSQFVDLGGLTPEATAGRSAEDIAGDPLSLGRKRIAIADLFEIEHGALPEIATGREEEVEITIRRASDKLCSIGAGMGEGRVEVHGTAGDYLGRGLRGGHIRVRGSAGHCVGQGMRGGLIEVSGDIGDFAGSAIPGATEGMNEGTILVSGNAGHRTGDRMRRGRVIVKGGVGDYLGSRMKGGTIVVLGPTGKWVGLAMRRGTIVLAQKPVEVPATFNSSGKLKMEFLRLLFRELGRSFRSLVFLRNYGPLSERLVGDLSAGGKGEILVLLAS